ncbi:hypothetical protein BDV98DRAFT_627331 [Pterulicium gracile]|uniref:Uncharacterized protein n=1 Tax=Pterulicium gracile TaxID=1884261 RepID=A0A5C3QET7_9AGAR|nr:hypothetical protein BDV98DRAFT_627331 [Pterula gracilis]
MHPCPSIVYARAHRRSPLPVNLFGNAVFLTDAIVFWTFSFEPKESLLVWTEKLYDTQLTGEQADTLFKLFAVLLFRLLKEFAIAHDATMAKKLLDQIAPDQDLEWMKRLACKNPGQFGLAYFFYRGRTMWLQSNLAWFEFAPHPTIISFLHSSVSDYCLMSGDDSLGDVVNQILRLPWLLVDCASSSFAVQLHSTSPSTQNIQTLRQLVNFIHVLMNDETIDKLVGDGSSHSRHILVTVYDMFQSLEKSSASDAIRAAIQSLLPMLAELATRRNRGLQEDALTEERQMWEWLMQHCVQVLPSSHDDVLVLWRYLKSPRLMITCWNPLCIIDAWQPPRLVDGEIMSSSVSLDEDAQLWQRLLDLATGVGVSEVEIEKIQCMVGQAMDLLNERAKKIVQASDLRSGQSGAAYE